MGLSTQKCSCDPGFVPERFDAALTEGRLFPRWADRSSMVIVAMPSSATARPKRRTSKQKRIPKLSTRKPANCARRIAMRAGRSNIQSQAVPMAVSVLDLQAIPAFGYKNHIGIDRAHGLIRTVGSDGRLPPIPRRPIAEPSSTRPTPPATSGRTRPSIREERKALGRQRPSQPVFRKKPQGKPMPEAVAGERSSEGKVRAYARRRLRPTKGPDGSGHSKDRSRPSHGEDWACQID